MMLAITGLEVRRGQKSILSIPSLQVAVGELLAVIGSNGAGKSTLLQSIGLLTPAEFKSYRFDGRPIRLPGDALSIRRQMGVVFQEPLLLDASVLENTASGLRLRGTPRMAAQSAAMRSLDRLRVGHLRDRHVRHLSGGEAQRVSLARALALTPKLLLLDEPFSALDILTRTSLLRELRPLLRETHTTTLLVTHDVTEVAQLADRVAVLESGRLVQVGTPAQVFTDPQSDLVRHMAELAREMTAMLAPLSDGAKEAPV